MEVLAPYCEEDTECPKKSNTASEESGALVSEAAEGEPEEKDILITLYSYLKGNAACSREGLDCILGKIS